MGRLIVNHLARLLALAASSMHLCAAFFSFFFPKILWDPCTTLLNPLVKPVPVLSVINTVLALLVLAVEWPLPILARLRTLHGSFEFRLLGLLPLAGFWVGLDYWGLDVAPVYVIAIGVYTWAWCRGEVSRTMKIIWA